MRVLGLSFFLLGVFEEVVSFFWVRSKSKLNPEGRESENSKFMPSLTRCWVKSMHLETREELISLRVSAWVVSYVLKYFLRIQKYHYTAVD